MILRNVRLLPLLYLLSVFFYLSLSHLSLIHLFSLNLSPFLLLFERACLCVCVLSVVLLSIFVFPRKLASGTMTMRVLTSSQCKLIQTSNGSFRTSFRNENNSRERREREKKKIGQLLFTIDLQFLSSRSQWPFVSGHPIGSFTNRNCVGDWNERFDWLRSSAALKCNVRKQDG